MTDEQLAADLEAQVANLRRRIAAAPRNSYSARQTAAFLDALERPDATGTTAEKLAAVRQAGRDLTDALRYGDDTIRHSPNLGPSANPRPRRK